MPLCAVSGTPVFDSFFNVSFRTQSEQGTAVLVDVSYPAIDALENLPAKGAGRIARVRAHMPLLEHLAGKKWDAGAFEDDGGTLRVQITPDDLPSP